MRVNNQCNIIQKSKNQLFKKEKMKEKVLFNRELPYPLVPTKSTSKVMH